MNKKLNLHEPYFFHFLWYPLSLTPTFMLWAHIFISPLYMLYSYLPIYCMFSHWVLSNPFVTPWTAACHGIFQTRMLEWVDILSSRGSSQPRDQTHVSCIDRWIIILCHLGSPCILYIYSIFCFSCSYALSFYTYTLYKKCCKQIWQIFFSVLV